MGNRLGATGHGPNNCVYCGERLEGPADKCGAGWVHEDCLDEIQSAETSLKFAKKFPEFLLLFLDEHMSDDFLDEFWEAFGEDYKMNIEGWAKK